MATVWSDSVSEQSPLDVIREEIIGVFERILSEVRARRDELLEQVSEIKREFATKSISVVESMKELEEMRSHHEKMSVKQNLAMKKQQESLADIDSEIEKLKIGLSNKSKFKFNCSINQLIEQVKHFGEVIDESSVVAKYRSKLTAVQDIILDQNPPISNSNKFHVDYDKQLLYLFYYLDKEKSSNDRPIVVLDASDFTCLGNFGEKGYSAECMAIGNEFIYVGCNRCASSFYTRADELKLYKKSGYSFIKNCNDLRNTRIYDICSTSDNQVFVLCLFDKTYKLRIYDRALNYIKEIILSHQFDKYDDDLKTLVRSERFYIMSKNCLFVLNTEGEIVRSEFNTEENPTLLKNPTSFCVDEVGNIIVTDSATNSIKFFSPNGNLFHKIGEDKVGSDEVIGAKKIVAFNGKVIVSTSDGRTRLY